MINIHHKMATVRVTVLCLLHISSIYVSGILGDFIITHAPDHVNFLNGANDLKLSEVQHVVSTAFGFDLHKDMSWNGLGQGDLFKRPKANVLFSLEGVPKSGLNIKNIASYETETDVPEVETQSVSDNIARSVLDETTPLVVDFSVDTTVFEIRTHQPDLFSHVPTSYDKLRQVFQSGESHFSPAEMGSLNFTKDADIYFLGELYLIREIITALKANQENVHGSLPDFFHFKVRGLSSLGEEHGQDAQQMKDALAMLERFIDQVTSDMRALYKDNVVIEVVTIPREEQILVRKARHLMADVPTTAAPEVNITKSLAVPYDEMYPVAFNIILWLMIVLVLAVIGISYGIWFMDPGRDSIIYRMTSQRIKKD